MNQSIALANQHQFALLIFLFVLVTVGESRICYLCMSDFSGHCGTNFDPDTSMKEPCGPDEHVCYKSLIKYEDRFIAWRGCYNETACDAGGFDVCEICVTDFCNGGPINA